MIDLNAMPDADKVEAWNNLLDIIENGKANSNSKISMVGKLLEKTLQTAAMLVEIRKI